MADEARNNRGHEGGNHRGSGYGHSGGSHRGNQGHGGFKGRGSRGDHYGNRGSGYRSHDRNDQGNDSGEGRYSERKSQGNFRRDDRQGYRGHDEHRSNYRNGDDRRSGYQGRDDRKGGYKGRDDQRSGYQGQDRGERRGGYQRFNKDDRGQRDDRRGSYQRYDRDDRQGGYQRRDHDDRRGNYQHRDHDDRRGGYQRHDRDDRQSGYNRNGRDDRRGGFNRGGKDNSKWEDRRNHNSQGERGHSYRDRDQHRDGGRSYDRRGEQGRDFRRDDRRQGSGRRDWQERSGQDRRNNGRNFDRNNSYQDGPRRNSDGTVSYPSQNPYTDARPGEPSMPKGLEWSMLSKDDKERLRGLSKEHAENIGLHILAAYALEESEPDRALDHAKWVARQASRVDIARETLALVAYRQGDYKLALREFRTAFRMNGYLDYLPFIADCERGLGNPRKAIEEATSYEAKALRGESKAEMFLVYAGALADLGLFDQAVQTVHQLAGAKGLNGDYRMRAVQAEQFFLDQAGHSDQAQSLDSLLDKLEAQYADEDDDEDSEMEIIVDNDLEHANDAMFESLDILTEKEYYKQHRYEPVDEDDADEAENTSEPVEEVAVGETLDQDAQSENSQESDEQAEQETTPTESTAESLESDQPQAVAIQEEVSDEATQTPVQLVVPALDPSDQTSANEVSASTEQGADGASKDSEQEA
ncbi:helicase [Bombiscardovia apis]|uniref:Helicase n=1 Tax=Bombiscardovia apis TaxID=2932182 RepID=A0ABN6SHY2_9BIFI|nr:helicase [Bombiscardovia apis]BDR54873.1 helicase [Bombiscardovia apis]